MHSHLESLNTIAQEFAIVRRDIHQHPELGYKEFRTSDLVIKLLISWGYSVTTGLGGTGVVGQLIRGDGQKRIGIRADMDALPIEEETGLAYASAHAGVMHACGHDGHTAMLLAAAKYLAQDGKLNGTLNLIFQPAEEGLGGAKKMMDDGLFEKFPCDAIFAMHNMPGHPPGQLMFRDGALMASSQNITITIDGVGGHGAMPQFAADPVVAGSAIVMALQSIVSRNTPPLEMAVITVGSFQAGQANNVIPQRAVLKLSVRSLSRDVHAMLKKRIAELVDAQAKSYGVTATVDFVSGYPVLVNTKSETDFARKIGCALVGEANVDLNTEPLTGSEDFAFMLEKLPGCYLLIGNGDQSTGGHGACMVHNSNYDFNDQNIRVGSAYWALLVEQYLV